MKILTSKDKVLVEKIRKKLKDNDGYCPCKIVRSEDTRCICKEFKEQDEAGPCHCGLYIIEEDN